MKARALLLVASLVLAVVISLTILVSPVLGWANGEINFNGGYGTHDWVVDQALRVAKAANPNYVAWFDRSTAVAASDDPDYLWNPQWQHHNYEVDLYGTYAGYGDAPSEIQLLFDQIVSLVSQRGDRTTISKKLGMMAHYYADINNPMHTWSTESSSAHRNYELATDIRTRYSSQNQVWVTLGAVAAPAGTVADYARLAAVDARQQFDSVKGFSRWTTVINQVTAGRLNRAANDLADLMAAVAQKGGYLN
jgi:hypothetical protein